MFWSCQIHWNLNMHHFSIFSNTKFYLYQRQSDTDRIWGLLHALPSTNALETFTSRSLYCRVSKRLLKQHDAVTSQTAISCMLHNKQVCHFELNCSCSNTIKATYDTYNVSEGSATTKRVCVCISTKPRYIKKDTILKSELHACPVLFVTSNLLTVNKFAQIKLILMDVGHGSYLLTSRCRKLSWNSRAVSLNVRMAIWR